MSFEDSCGPHRPPIQDIELPDVSARSVHVHAFVTNPRSSHRIGRVIATMIRVCNGTTWSLSGTPTSLGFSHGA